MNTYNYDVSPNRRNTITDHCSGRIKAKDCKKIRPETGELVVDGGFVVPENNSYGRSFRDYGAENERKETVEELYRLSHISQTYDFVKRMRKIYKSFDRVEMSIWECCELLNEVVDDSDPDLDEPQIQHLLQTAEGIRKDYPNEDWLHLTALIHDLGKVLLLPSFGGLPQWAVVALKIMQQFKDSPDYNNPAYNTKLGIYSEGCGLDNVSMSWGHDDYMYLLLHDGEALHKSRAYGYLMNEEDVENLKWLQIFSKYDLYSKSKVKIDVDKVKSYYISLAEKITKPEIKFKRIVRFRCEPIANDIVNAGAEH
ncbi:hypothetical protein DH2020_030252 [Rehmannia glutinosa]|uniref:Inositol oxygenase n=1 Tax=Rehmannia glutinosa TaxID=99300 RepID=A0ABR0VL90_REHGL